MRPGRLSHSIIIIIISKLDRSVTNGAQPSVHYGTVVLKQWAPGDSDT